MVSSFVLAELKGHSASAKLNQICWNSSDDGVVTAGSDGLVIYHSLNHLLGGQLDLKKRDKSYKFVGHQGPVWSVDIQQKSQLIASCSSDCSIRLWKKSILQQPIIVSKAHLSAVRCVRFGIQDNILISSGCDKSIKIWDLGQSIPKFKRSFLGHLNWVRTVDIKSDDNRIIASGSDDKTVRIWDERQVQKSSVQIMTEGSGSISKVLFHPSGNLIAACSNDQNYINLWDIRSTRNQIQCKLIQHYKDVTNNVNQQLNSNGVTSIDFGGVNNQLMISSNQKGTISLWDIKSSEMVAQYSNSQSNSDAYDVKISRDAKFFVSASNKGQAYLWRLQNITQQKEEINQSNDFTDFELNEILSKQGDALNDLKTAIELAQDRVKELENVLN